jgi:hypothetical protein
MAFQEASTVVAIKGGARNRSDLKDAFEDSDKGEAIIENAPVDDDK